MFWWVFFVSLCISISLTLKNYRTSPRKNPDQKWFQNKFLVVYTLAYFSDWLKGPYVYALYESYNLTENDIAILFIVGFGASGIVGPLVGSLADNWGRKPCSMGFFVMYIASAFCKVTPNYSVLLLGRFLGGVGTALLSTVLESWMVAEHKRLQYSQELLDDTFAKATLCNSVAAILAGLIAQFSADTYGYLAPFMLAIIPLALGLYICGRYWNRTNNQSQASSGFKRGLSAMDKNLWILGLTQSFFMGAMYTFVFLWTPALQSEQENIPYGLIFAIFMVMISIGSNIFPNVSHMLERIPMFLFISGSVLMLGTVFALGSLAKTFTTFCLFEMLCGLMFPTFGSLRAIYIPEEYRTTIMNIYGIPLNTFVVILLLNKKNMSLQVSFSICCAILFISAILWRQFETTINHGERQKYSSTFDEEEYELDSDVGDLESDNSDF